MATKSDPRDAIALLKAEHREVLNYFEEFEKTESDSRKQKLATQICTDLTIHALLEEEIFYPAFRGKIDDDMIDEAYVEHDSAKVMIAQIMAGAPGQDFWDAKVKVLGEEIEHHIEEEEKPSEGIFYEARQTDVDLIEMGDQMRTRKAQLQAKFEAEGLPAPETRTFAAEPEIELGEEIEEPIAPVSDDRSAAPR